MGCNILRFKNCEIVGTTFEGRTFKIEGADVLSMKAVVTNKSNSKKPIEIIGNISDNTCIFNFKSLEKLSANTYYIEYWADLEGVGTEVLAVETFDVVKSTDTNCGCQPNLDINTNLVFQKHEIKVDIKKIIYNEVVKNESNTTTPINAEEPKISIVNSQLLDIADTKTVLLTIFMESEVEFNIKFIKLIGDEGKILPFMREDTKHLIQHINQQNNSKTINFTDALNNSFGRALIEVSYVEVGVEFNGREKTIFKFVTPSESVLKYGLETAFTFTID